MVAATFVSMLIAVGEATGGQAADPSPWEQLESGLEVAHFDGPAGGVGGDGKIVVARIDPAAFELRLLNASAPGEGKVLSARRWAEQAGASVAINASMYQGDHRTSVSLMHTRAHVNQRRVSKDRAALAFEPLVRGVPPVRIIDRDCEPLEVASRSYGTVIQSIRLVSCGRKNVWAPSERRFSVAAVGVDGKGRVLFFHARTAWPVHQVVDTLLALPIDLRGAMYVEGGPEAQLYVRSKGREVERLGAFEAVPGADNRDPWPLPNVIAAVRRSR